MESAVLKEIQNHLLTLTPEQQKKVLQYIKSFSSPSKEFSGKELLKFIGAIDKEDLEKMTLAIQDGCEKIDYAEW
ncbi:hypothetical protein [Desulfoscipio geothermicus]|uniref:DUF2281 domain-containing protein n=1 Tax=Desulfoscipio geothermicus DSM 3669 TaxID=1121426 RepID=A0A1I6E8C2_9FIRM|nr:hypothetical protein [Desulfoscipio geothermicus]SFR13985.1 hypothetical protein SAMN05660706_12943 [Desulfoscipio geothermicus DSM 3669]